MKKEQNLIKQELEQLKLDSYNSKKEKYVRKKLKKVGINNRLVDISGFV